MTAQPESGAPSAESLVFAPGVTEHLGAYVYLLIDPRDDEIFYVGKGRGNRAYAHAHEALGPVATADDKHLKLPTIRDIHHAGLTVRLEILRHGLSDVDAFIVEAAAIDLVRRMRHQAPPTNIQSGHGAELGLATVDQLAARYAARHVAITDPLLLIRPSNLWWSANTEAERYEATRGWWRAAPASRARVSHAAAVVDGIVRMVWRIEGWRDDTAKRRAAFHGVRDPGLEERYVWADVSDLLPHGAQNPIRYVIPRDDAPAGVHVDKG
jgi:hypothetical protein